MFRIPTQRTIGADLQYVVRNRTSAVGYQLPNELLSFRRAVVRAIFSAALVVVLIGLFLL
jgi:hypothetical protein